MGPESTWMGDHMGNPGATGMDPSELTILLLHLL